MKVSTTVSFSNDTYGRGETGYYTREVDEIDIHDWMWYIIKVSELAGFDVDQITITTSQGDVVSTEL